MDRTQSGQALVETALTIPILVVLLMAIVSLGYLFNSQLVVTNACREGARSGAIGKPSDTVRQTVNDFLSSGGLQPARATIQVQGAGAPSGSLLSVQVSYSLELPVAVTGLPSALTLSARSAMRIE